MLINLLSNSDFKFTDGKSKIQFCINDKMLRLYLYNRLNEIGSFADSSFNSNIVTITPKDLLFLLGTDKLNDDIKLINKSLSANSAELPQSMCDNLKFLTETVIKHKLGDTGYLLTKWIGEWIKNIKIV